MHGRREGQSFSAVSLMQRQKRAPTKQLTTNTETIEMRAINVPSVSYYGSGRPRSRPWAIEAKSRLVAPAGVAALSTAAARPRPSPPWRRRRTPDAANKVANNWKTASTAGDARRDGPPTQACRCLRQRGQMSREGRRRGGRRGIPWRPVCVNMF